MVRRPHVVALAAAVMITSPLLGCGESPSTATATQHDESSFGERGKTPAAGPNSPLAKKAAAAKK